MSFVEKYDGADFLVIDLSGISPSAPDVRILVRYNCHTFFPKVLNRYCLYSFRSCTAINPVSPGWLPIPVVIPPVLFCTGAFGESQYYCSGQVVVDFKIGVPARGLKQRQPLIIPMSVRQLVS